MNEWVFDSTKSRDEFVFFFLIFILESLYSSEENLKEQQVGNSHSEI